jgi:hypothetical protein
MTRWSILAPRYTRRAPSKSSRQPDLLALGMAALPCCTAEDVEAEVLRVDRPVYPRRPEFTTQSDVRHRRRPASPPMAAVERPCQALQAGP